MCGGMLGEAFGAVDKGLNAINPLEHASTWLTDNTLGKIPGIGKPAARLGDWGISHPAEVAALAAGGYGAWAGLGAGAAGAAGETAGMADGALGAESIDAGAFTNAGMGGAADLAAAGMGGAAVANPMGGMSEMSTGTGFGGVGTDPGVATSMDGGLAAGQEAANSGNFLSGLFGKGGIGLNLNTAKNGLGAMQLLSSLYGMEQSRKLQRAATSSAMSTAGLQAVQRSMAAGGYQGSGNMMTALSKYGADAYSGNIAQQQQGLGNTLGSLGLLTAGMGNLFGWGSTGGKP